MRDLRLQFCFSHFYWDKQAWTRVDDLNEPMKLSVFNPDRRIPDFVAHRIRRLPTRRLFLYSSIFIIFRNLLCVPEEKDHPLASDILWRAQFLFIPTPLIDRTCFLVLKLLHLGNSA